MKRFLLAILVFCVDLFVLGLIPGTPFYEVFVLLLVDFVVCKLFEGLVNNHHEK